MLETLIIASQCMLIATLRSVLLYHACAALKKEQAQIYARALVNDYHPNEIEEKKYIKKEKKGQNRANT